MELQKDNPAVTAFNQMAQEAEELQAKRFSPRKEKAAEMKTEVKDEKPKFDLKPCPFCGSRHTFAIQMDWSTRERKPYKIFCDSCCACSGPHDTMEGAIAAWNERIRRSIEPKWLYRLESISPENGLWYSDDAKFVFGIGKIEGCKTKDLPMGWDKRYHVEGKNWYSSCSRKEDLLHWYSKEDARKLLANGFVFTRYLANDYIEYENETVFRKECAARREEIDFFELFNNEER